LLIFRLKGISRVDEIKNKIMVAMMTMSVEITIIEDNDDNK